MLKQHLWRITLFILLITIAGSAVQLQIIPSAQAQEPDNHLEMLPGERVAVEGITEVRLPAQVAVAEVVSVPANMSQNFEGVWPAAGWVLSDESNTDGGEYLWGKRNCRPRTGSFAGWSVGGGANGGTLSCSANYPNNANTWAIYGPFDLSSATSASLTFHLWGRTAGAAGCPWDYLFVGSSTNGTEFSNGTRYCGDWTGGDAGNGYYQDTLDLNSRLGQSQVWIGFSFFSNASVTNNGFTIDDITFNVISPPQPPAEWKIFLPISGRNWTPPTPIPTPTPPLDDIPCLLVIEHLNSERDFNFISCFPSSGGPPRTDWRHADTGAINGFDITITNGQGIIIYQASIDIQRADSGKITSYEGMISRNGFPTFTENIVNKYNPEGGFISADVTKIVGGSQYQMQITKICITGYKVKIFAPPYNGQEVVAGSCS